MDPRNRSAVYVWTDETEGYLLECWHTLVAANDARDVNKLNTIQLSVKLRRLFCSKYPECNLASATLYKRAIMCSRRVHHNRSAVFVWTDETKGYLLECWHTLVAANDARDVNKLNRAQLSVKLRRQFCSKYPECNYASATLYNFIINTINDRPLSAVFTHGSKPITAFWNTETDDFLIRCVAQAHEDNSRDIRLGLLAGKLGRPSRFRKKLVDLFTHRYPNVSESYIFKRVTHLRKQKRINSNDDGEAQQQQVPVVSDTSASPAVVTNNNDNAGTGERPVPLDSECKKRKIEEASTSNCGIDFVDMNSIDNTYELLVNSAPIDDKSNVLSESVNIKTENSVPIDKSNVRSESVNIKTEYDPDNIQDHTYVPVDCGQEFILKTEEIDIKEELLDD